MAKDSEEEKRPVGRPPQGGPTPPRSIRVSDEDWATLQDAARRAGKSFSEWALDILLKKAKKR